MILSVKKQFKCIRIIKEILIKGTLKTIEMDYNIYIYIYGTRYITVMLCYVS